MKTIDERAEQLKQELGKIEMEVLTNVTLGQLIREGAGVSEEQTRDWNSCALANAVIAAKARDIL